ncbi:hypothetical protein GGQ92_001295 [Gracilibacillus halotolerans]|uniref:DUF4064 domain-containing protein n=1 Tax=Gracilibacillus halotolerans TaxID=74386 RepID=A0A841RKN4_9BACI|nr:hypothetical protein [Gracilibacillus halotolerans]MBB6512512.1 hypothetical protein [Gracilibacillus halotolerans]
MKRKMERVFIIIGSLWNLITAFLTMFSYNSWFQSEGAKQFQNAETNLALAGGQMINNISKIIFLFGLFMLIASIINFVVAMNVKDNEIQYKLIIWIGIWTAIQLVSMDIIGFVFYMLAFVIYMAKNKAIKLAQSQVSTQ